MPTVMVVDDADAARKIMGRLLRREGYAAICVGSGREAMMALKTARPDLLLLDLVMPEMDGLAVLEAVREDPRLKSLPVVVMSADNDYRSLSRARQLGARECLLKSRLPWASVLGRLKQHLPAA